MTAARTPVGATLTLTHRVRSRLPRNGRTTEQRLLAMAGEPDENGCEPWVGTITRDGYGQIRVGSRGRDRRTALAHRVAYELAVGPIPAGLTIDHLCANRRCVNPAHLEAVSQRENTLRGESPAAANAAKETCHRDHPLTPGNLVPYALARGRRSCLTCQRIHGRASDARARGLARLRAAWEAGTFSAPGGADLFDALCREHERRVDALQAEWFEASAPSARTARGHAAPPVPEREREPDEPEREADARAAQLALFPAIEGPGS